MILLAKRHTNPTWVASMGENGPLSVSALWHPVTNATCGNDASSRKSLPGLPTWRSNARQTVSSTRKWSKTSSTVWNWLISAHGPNRAAMATRGGYSRLATLLDLCVSSYSLKKRLTSQRVWLEPKWQWHSLGVPTHPPITYVSHMFVSSLLLKISSWLLATFRVLTWGGGIFRPKPPVFDRSWRSPSKNIVKNSTEDTCSWTRPSKIGKRKVKKTRVFQFFDLNVLVCNIFFCGSAGGLARKRIFEFLDPFSDWFSSFCDSRNTGFYSVFLFSACLTASFKTSKNLVNYAVLCYGVNENIVNTSVFWRWHLTLKNHGICSGFCFSPRKNTVNNSNFAVFFMFFVIFWTALVRYTWLSNSSRVFFPTISTFGCFWSQWPTSLAVTSGCPTMRCGRLPSRSDVNIFRVAGNLSGLNIGIITENKVCHPHFVLCTSRLK